MSPLQFCYNFLPSAHAVFQTSIAKNQVPKPARCLHRHAIAIGSVQEDGGAAVRPLAEVSRAIANAYRVQSTSSEHDRAASKALV